MRDWKKKPVAQHFGGITDDVHGSGTEFQEECENLFVSRADGDLEVRPGCKYFGSETPVGKFTTVADVSDSLDGKFFRLENGAGAIVAFWIDTNDSGTPEPSHEADRAVEITTIATNDTADDVATKVRAFIDGDADFFAAAPVGPVVTPANTKSQAIPTNTFFTDVFDDIGFIPQVTYGIVAPFGVGDSGTTKIRELFRLEEYLFAYVYDDPAIPGDDIDGQLWWIREDRRSIDYWRKVTTARGYDKFGYTLSQTRTTIDYPDGDGFQFYVTGPNDLTIDNSSFICRHATTGVTAAPVVGPYIFENAVNTLWLTLNTDYIDSDGLWNDLGFTSPVTYDQISTTVGGLGYTIALNPGTTGTDPIIINGSFSDNPGVLPDPTHTVSPQGDYQSIFTKPGRVTADEWAGHLFLSLEPDDKTFTAHPDDPEGLDPDTYPPDNSRESTKKVYLKLVDSVIFPKCTNAQMPKTFTSIERTASVDHYHFFEFDLAFLDNNEDGSPEINHDHTAVNWRTDDDHPMLKLWIGLGSAERFGDPFSDDGVDPALSDDRSNSFVMENLIVDVYPDYYDDGSGYTKSDIPIVFDSFDDNVLIDSYWLNYYALLAADGLLVLIPASDVESATNAGDQAIWANPENIREAIETAFANYNTRPNTFVNRGRYAPLSYSTAWRDNVVGKQVVISQNYRGSDYMWYDTSPDIDRGIIKSMYVGLKIVLDDQYVSNAKVLYKYGSYVRESYTCIVEGAPRQFIFDGPADILQVGTIEELKGETLWHDMLCGLTTSVYDSSAYLIDYNQVEARLSRSKANGDVYYEETQSGVFWPVDAADGKFGLDGDPWSEDDGDWLTKVGAYASMRSEISDDDLGNKAFSYFNSGNLTYDALPQNGSYYFTMVNQTSYWGNTFGASNRVYQSIIGVPSSSPSTFFNDFNDTVTGLNNFADKCIVFTPITTWRIEGQRGSTGTTGRTFQRVVSDEYGAISNNSIVKTNKGLFFFSLTGICFTDGLKAFRVTDHLVEKYKEWMSWNTDTSYISGTYHENEQRIYWSLKDLRGVPFWVCLDLYGAVNTTMPVQTAKGNDLLYKGNSRPVVKSMFDTNVMLYSEKTLRFYRAQDHSLLYHDRNFSNDQYWLNESSLDTQPDDGIMVDLNDPGTVQQIPIKPYYKSVGISYDAKDTNKWTHRVLLSARQGQLPEKSSDVIFRDGSYVTPRRWGVALQPLGWNDFGEHPHELPGMLNYQDMGRIPSTYGANSPAGGKLGDWSPYDRVQPGTDTTYYPRTYTGPVLEQYWNHSDVAFRNQHHIAFRRRFPKGRIRNIYKQFGFRELPVTQAEVIKNRELDESDYLQNFTFERPGDITEPRRRISVQKDTRWKEWIFLVIHQSDNSLIAPELGWSEEFSNTKMIKFVDRIGNTWEIRNFISPQKDDPIWSDNIFGIYQNPADYGWAQVIDQFNKKEEELLLFLRYPDFYNDATGDNPADLVEIYKDGVAKTVTEFYEDAGLGLGVEQFQNETTGEDQGGSSMLSYRPIYDDVDKTLWETNNPNGFRISFDEQLVGIQLWHDRFQMVQLELIMADPDDFTAHKDIIHSLGITNDGTSYIQIPNGALSPDDQTWFRVMSISYSSGDGRGTYFILLDVPNLHKEIDSKTFHDDDLDRFTVGRVPKNQRMSILDFTLQYSYLSDRTIGVFVAPENGGDNG